MNNILQCIRNFKLTFRSRQNSVFYFSAETSGKLHRRTEWWSIFQNRQKIRIPFGKLRTFWKRLLEKGPVSGVIIGSISSISLRWGGAVVQVCLGPASVVHLKPQVEVASSNPFESVFAIYKPDFEVVRIFTNLSENFSRWWTTPSWESWKIRSFEGTEKS